jgi:hypothetical protein
MTDATWTPDGQMAAMDMVTEHMPELIPVLDALAAALDQHPCQEVTMTNDSSDILGPEKGGTDALRPELGRPGNGSGSRPDA